MGAFGKTESYRVGGYQEFGREAQRVEAFSKASRKKGSLTELLWRDLSLGYSGRGGRRRRGYRCRMDKQNSEGSGRVMT